MKLYFKRFLTLSFLALVALVATKIDVFAATSLQSELNAIGISIPEEYSPRYMTGVQRYSKERYTGGNLDYKTSVREVLARNNLNPEIHLFTYWVQTSPQQYKTGGFLGTGIGSKGFNWHSERVETHVEFTTQKEQVSILDWAPKNKPSGISGTIGVGIGMTGPEISASVDFSHSTLKVSSLTNAGTKKYGTKYTFQEPWAYLATDYNRGTINSIGMFTFEKAGNVWMNVRHEIEYWNSVQGLYKNNQSFVNFENNY